MSILALMVFGTFPIAGMILFGGLLLWVVTSRRVQDSIKRRSDRIQGDLDSKRGFEVLKKPNCK